MKTEKFPTTIDRSLTASELLAKVGPQPMFSWVWPGPTKMDDDPEWDSPIVPAEGSYEAVIELLEPFAYDPEQGTSVLSWEADYILWDELRAALQPSGPLCDYRLATPREVLEACAQHREAFFQHRDQGRVVACFGGFWREKASGRQKFLEVNRYMGETELVNFETADSVETVIPYTKEHGSAEADLEDLDGEYHVIEWPRWIAIVRKGSETPS